MKKYIIITLVSILATGYAAAQKDLVEIRNTALIKEGDHVRVTFEMYPGEVPSDYEVTITPIVYNGDGDWQMLRSVKVVGKKRDVYDRRTGTACGERYVVTNKTQVPLIYENLSPYEEWMQYVSVAVQQVVEGCCRQHEHPLQQTAENKLLYYELAPHFDVKPYQYELTELEKYDLDNPFLHPMEDYGKRYQLLETERDKGTSVLIFTVGSHRLDENHQGNKDVLTALGKAFQLIESDPNASLKHIMIAGYASPEGALSFNTALAERRANSVKTYIQRLLNGSQDHLFELYNGREDWEGLREKVDNSDLFEKQDILEIIDAYTIEQEERKSKLKQFMGGGAYRYMLEHFYPPLRSAGYIQVYYEIDRTATVATAVTDDKGRTTWIDPDSPRNRSVTLINKALEHMVDSEFDKALELMKQFSEDPRTWNNLGVCYMMLGDYGNAEYYLSKALEHGDANAAGNLEQIAWAKKVIKE